MNLKQTCGCRGKKEFTLDDTGSLYCREGADWALYDFNSLYQGYYPSVTFTLIEYTGEVFYLAGTDPHGRPHLFSSLEGGVWEERTLDMRDPLYGSVSARGNIRFLLYDERRRQIFLLCDSGQLITLPDCPHCVQIRSLKSKDILHASLENDQILIQYSSGESEEIPAELVAQYRISPSYAKEHFSGQAILVDLRGEDPDPGEEKSTKVNLDPNDLPFWLQKQEKNTVLLFVCQSGIRADLAAEYARTHGFPYAYSLGQAQPS